MSRYQLSSLRLHTRHTSMPKACIHKRVTTPGLRRPRPECKTATDGRSPGCVYCKFSDWTRVITSAVILSSSPSLAYRDVQPPAMHIKPWISLSSPYKPLTVLRKGSSELIPIFIERVDDFVASTLLGEHAIVDRELTRWPS